MDSTTVEILLKNGIAGVLFLVVTVPLAVYARHLAATLKEVQDRRAADAQQIVDKLLSLNDKWNQTVSQHISAVESIDSMLKDVKGALGNFGEVRTLVSGFSERLTEHARVAEEDMREMKSSLASLREVTSRCGRR